MGIILLLYCCQAYVRYIDLSRDLMVNMLEGCKLLPLSLYSLLNLSTSRALLYRLSSCNVLITWLCLSQIYAGQQLESFSIQLLCLAIWKEALRVCQTWACNVGDFGKVCSNERGSISEGGESDERSAANACSLVEREFAFAVGRAESLAVHINSGIGKWALLISHMEYLV